jgi:hypothetical protein
MTLQKFSSVKLQAIKELTIKVLGAYNAKSPF